LPKKPTEVEVKVIEEMFKASVDGEPYDLEKFGQYYRPYGLKAPETSKPAAPVAPVVETPAPAPAVETVAPVTAPEPVQAEAAPVTATAEATPAPETGSKAEDILAMIRARQQKS